MGLFDAVKNAVSSVFSSAEDAASSAGSSVIDTASSAGSSLQGLVADDIAGVVMDAVKDKVVESLADALVESGASTNAALSTADEIVRGIDFADVVQRLDLNQLAEAVEGLAEPEQLEVVSNALQEAILPELGDLGIAGVDMAEVAATIAESAAPEILPLLLVV